MHNGGHEFGGHNDNDEVRDLAYGGEVRVTFKPFDGVGLRIDGEYFTGKAGVKHRFEYFVADLSLLARCADYSD